MIQAADDDLLIELSRMLRECEDRVAEKIAASQLGEAFKDIEDEVKLKKVA